MTTIRGKLALVTGASSGIGRSCARRFAAEGANLVLWARRKERLEQLALDLAKEHGASVRVDGVDVRDREAVDRAAEAVVAAGLVPDILLNNAGLAAGLDKLHEGDHDDWDRMIDTNLKGLLYVSRALIPHMVKAGRGHIVNIGSTAGHWVYPMGNVYNATKYGVRALTEGMNVDLAGTPLRVSCVDPGHVRTEFATVRYHGDEKRVETLYKGFQPLSPDDVADVVAYVVSVPAHVNILDVVVMPTAQRSISVIHRE